MIPDNQVSKRIKIAILKNIHNQTLFHQMTIYKKIFLFLIIFSVISCGKNKESEEHEIEQKNEPSYEQKTTTIHDPQKNKITYDSPEDSIRTVKNSILRKQKFKKKVIGLHTYRHSPRNLFWLTRLWE